MKKLTLATLTFLIFLFLPLTIANSDAISVKFKIPTEDTDSGSSGGGGGAVPITNIEIEPDTVTLFFNQENEFIISIHNKNPYNETLTISIPQEIQKYTYIDNIHYSLFNF